LGCCYTNLSSPLTREGNEFHIKTAFTLIISPAWQLPANDDSLNFNDFKSILNADEVSMLKKAVAALKQLRKIYTSSVIKCGAA
jgi:hypothetical protein